jgi:hypothetical protein
MGCTPIDVEVEVITPDQLRKIVFGLVKTCHADDSASWKINFELDEKKNASDGNFSEVAKVSVAIGQDDHDAAQSTAKSIKDDNQLSDAATAQALAAGDTLKSHAAQPDHPDVKDAVTQVLHADDEIPASAEAGG